MRGSAVGQAEIRIAARAEQRAESKRIMLASESLAIGAAFCLALGSMISAELKGRLSIITLTLWQTATAALLLLALASFTGGWSTIRAWHVPYICASGLFGTVLANASFVGAIFIAGPRRAVLLFSLNAPFALVLGFLVLGEAVRPLQALGVALVILGIALAVLFGGLPAVRPRSGRSDAAVSASELGLGLGVLLGVGSALFQAIANLIARPVMSDHVDPFAAMSLRATFAAACFFAVSLLPLRMLGDHRAFSWRLFAISAAGAAVSTGLGMSLLMAALASGQVGIVSTLSSLAPVLILPMVWLRTGVVPSARAWAGALLAVLGIALIAVG
jgi:drug/metabolite transporter (DMT)-like permease